MQISGGRRRDLGQHTVVPESTGQRQTYNASSLVNVGGRMQSLPSRPSWIKEREEETRDSGGWSGCEPAREGHHIPSPDAFNKK